MNLRILSTNIRLSNFKQVKNVCHIRDRRSSYFPGTLVYWIFRKYNKFEIYFVKHPWDQFWKSSSVKAPLFRTTVFECLFLFRQKPLCWINWVLMDYWPPWKMVEKWWTLILTKELSSLNLMGPACTSLETSQLH